MYIVLYSILIDFFIGI